MPALSPVAHPFRGEALPRAYRAASNASSALLRIALAGSLTSNVLLIHGVKSVKSHEAWPQRRSTVRIPTITSRTGEQMKATARRVGFNCAALALAMIGMIRPAQTAKSAATAANDTYKMKQVQVIDRAALGQPTPAADLLIPTDWKFESNVQWENRGCFTDLAAMTFRAQSPDGRLVIEAFPSFSWQWASDPAVQKYSDGESPGRAGRAEAVPGESPRPGRRRLEKVRASEVSLGQRLRHGRADTQF
jgi:hypothetical protein